MLIQVALRHNRVLCLAPSSLQIVGTMPRGPKGEKRPADVIGNAVMIARIATGEIEDQRREKNAR